MKVKVIIPASGSGIRFGGNTPKQFLKSDGKEIIVRTIEKFNGNKSVNEIIISTKLEYFEKISSLVSRYKLTKVKKIVQGGNLRQDSVYSALINSGADDEDIILVHDAVRPFITSKKITEIINEARKENCVIPGLPVSETLKLVGKNNFVDKTIDRNSLYSIQTPQAFRYKILIRSFEKAYRDNFIGTDESSLAENAGYKVKVIQGERNNIKITVKEDLKLK